MLFEDHIMAISVVIFVLTYAVIVFRYETKTLVSVIAVILFLFFGTINPKEAFLSINWNVMGIYVGMLFISEVFIRSRCADLLADSIVNKSARVWIAMIGVSALSGFLSIAIANVAVVLIIAPIALHIAHKLKINATPLIIGIALMANLEGVATLIGDPPSLLMASYAHMTFNDFFFFGGKPGLFFAMQIAAITGLVFLYFYFKNLTKHPSIIKAPHVKSFFPAFILVLMVALLAFSSVFSIAGDGSNALLLFIEQNKMGLISLFLGLVVWIWYYFQKRDEFLPLAKNLDWSTGVFLICIFILIAGLAKVGFMTFLAETIAVHLGTNPVIAFIIIVGISVVLSAFIDNIPFIAAMLPVINHLATIMGSDPFVLYFALLVAACVGGNVTPVGATANIVAMSILHKNKYKVSFMDFVKIGLPFTIVTVFFSTLFIWLVFS